jgi:uncharacterized protein YdeI (YjbR/CyaY-like superfamily)
MGSDLALKAHLSPHAGASQWDASRNGEAKTAFDLLSYSNQKEYVTWITEAKKEETRARRIEKAIEMLPKRKTPMG